MTTERNDTLLSERGCCDDDDDLVRRLDKAIGKMEQETDALLESIIQDNFTPPSPKKPIAAISTEAFHDQRIVQTIGPMEVETNEILDSLGTDLATPPSASKTRFDMNDNNNNNCHSNTNHVPDHKNRSNEGSSSPSSKRSRSYNPLRIHHPKSTLLDDAAAEEEDWDDEIRDEINRLGSVTEALRQHLDSQNVESMTTALAQVETTTTSTNNRNDDTTTTTLSELSSASSSSSRHLHGIISSSNNCQRTGHWKESVWITSLAVVVWAIVLRLLYHVMYGELDAKGQFLAPSDFIWIFFK